MDGLEQLALQFEGIYVNPSEGTARMRPTLDDLREAVTTLEDAEQTGRRVLGGANPITELIEFALRNARAALHAREAGKTVVFAEPT